MIAKLIRLVKELFDLSVCDRSISIRKLFKKPLTYGGLMAVYLQRERIVLVIRSPSR